MNLIHVVVFSSIFIFGCTSMRGSHEVRGAHKGECVACQESIAHSSSITVSSPGSCNDYPVGYRAQETDGGNYIRPLDRIALASKGKIHQTSIKCIR